MARFAGELLFIAVLIVITFLPFVPGGYDPLSGPLSSMAWVLGHMGLVLVPVGLLWLWAIAKCRAHRWLVSLTVGACTFLSLAMVVIAFSSSGVLLATCTAAALSIPVISLARRLRQAIASPPSRLTAVILTIAPIVVMVAQTALVDAATVHARNRVIANAAPLIAEIEQYRARRGAYPESLFSIWGDYKPSIRGVERYHYERSSEAYNVIVKVPSLGFGTHRFVVYNPRDQQRVTVHEQDRLLLDDAALDRDNAGYTIVEPLSQPHWKSFLFLS